MSLSLREACVLAIAILGGTPGTTDIRVFLERDGWRASQGCIRATLGQMRGAAVEVASHGRAGSGQPTRWRLTEAARAWAAADT